MNTASEHPSRALSRASEHPSRDNSRASSPGLPNLGDRSRLGSLFSTHLSDSEVDDDIVLGQDGKASRQTDRQFGYYSLSEMPDSFYTRDHSTMDPLASAREYEKRMSGFLKQAQFHASGQQPPSGPSAPQHNPAVQPSLSTQPRLARLPWHNRTRSFPSPLFMGLCPGRPKPIGWRHP
jgi:hypothetical protein